MTIQFNLPAKFIGISQRQDRNDATKFYAEIHLAAAAKQEANKQVGAQAVSYNADASLFKQLAAAKFGDPLVVIVEEFEWTKDGVTQNRKTVIGIEHSK